MRTDRSSGRHLVSVPGGVWVFPLQAYPLPVDRQTLLKTFPSLAVGNKLAD